MERQGGNPNLHRLGPEEIAPAMELVWQVFSEFEAPEYSAEGIAEFRHFIQPDHILTRMQSGGMALWGWFDQTRCVGVIAVTVTGHINLLFVEAAYQRRGIAKALMEKAETCFAAHGAAGVTVNASPYAVEIYRRFGFQPVDAEQTVNGIRFTPMILSRAPKQED